MILTPNLVYSMYNYQIIDHLDLPHVSAVVIFGLCIETK